MKSLGKLIFCSLSILLALGIAETTHAQTLDASGQINGIAVGGGLYNYTLTLKNASDATSSIEYFWFGELPGLNFLPTSPTSVSPPSGWTDIVTHGGSDGYGIEFDGGSMVAIVAGSSLTFSFQSADSPAQINANSPFYPTYPASMSILWGGTPFGPFSPSEELVPQPVPEPSSMALVMLCGLGLMGMCWRISVQKFCY